MIRRGVWRVRKRRDIPPGRRCVKNKWVFKIKRDGVYRARLVACGYSQIAGVDFIANFAPVVHDASFRIVLIAILVFAFKAKIVDVITAFLYGDLEEEVYMDCPEGLDNVGNDDCVELKKAIYGLVQAARQFWKKFVEKLKLVGFEGGSVDPCLYVKRSNLGICIVCWHVDDAIFAGDKEAVEDAVESLKRVGFELKVNDDFKDYLSCEVLVDKSRKMAWLGQPHLLKKLDIKFGDKVKDLQEYRTPGSPGMGIIRPKDIEPKVDEEQHNLFRSGVGMLLYLVKYSRPDIANATRELSKVMDGPTEAAMKELFRLVKFVLDTKDKGLRMVPESLDKEAKWSLKLFCDSDFGGDKDN